MPDVSTSPHIQQIHTSGRQLVLSTTGGGSRAISDLLTVPGASASVLEAVVPYAPQALTLWLGGPADHACSERTARAMAMASFERARALADGDIHALRGIGATASLASARPKRGPHRLHIAWQSAAKTVVVSCELAKGARSRAEEEDVAARLILEIVAEACDVESATIAAPTAEEPIARREKLAPTEWSELLFGRRQLWERSPTAISFSATESPPTELPDPPKILFPGAFHPFHSGQRAMAEVAARRLGAAVTFELSIANVDKPPLDFVEIDDRLRGLPGERVWLTRAATFAEKASLAPGATFVVGADTIARIGDVRYYAEDSARRDAAIAAIAGQGCRFLVFGRQWDHKFHSLSELRLPPVLAALCEEVPEAEFREDVSSTILRTGV
jgi:nicotinamide mononucleotide (NMN) deamidase PncC